MKRHYKPSGWLTSNIQYRGDREYVYTIYRYQTERGERTKNVPQHLAPLVRKAIDERKPVEDVLAIILGESPLAIAS